jgi:hypothetical protein
MQKFAWGQVGAISYFERMDWDGIPDDTREDR